MHYVSFAFSLALCLIRILLHLHFATFVLCLICILSCLYFVMFTFCIICIAKLSPKPNWGLRQLYFQLILPPSHPTRIEDWDLELGSVIVIGDYIFWTGIGIEMAWNGDWNWDLDTDRKLHFRFPFRLKYFIQMFTICTIHAKLCYIFYQTSLMVVGLLDKKKLAQSQSNIVFRLLQLKPLHFVFDMKDDIPTIYAKFGYIFDRSVDAGLLKNQHQPSHFQTTLVQINKIFFIKTLYVNSFKLLV